MKQLTEAEKRLRNFWRVLRPLAKNAVHFNAAFQRAEKLRDGLILVLEAALAEEQFLWEEAHSKEVRVSRKKPAKALGVAGR